MHLGPAMQGLALERFAKAKFGMGEPDEASAAAHEKNGFPRVAGWIDRLEARPSWETAVAPICEMLEK